MLKGSCLCGSLAYEADADAVPSSIVTARPVAKRMGCHDGFGRACLGRQNQHVAGLGGAARALHYRGKGRLYERQGSRLQVAVQGLHGSTLG
jgi:hypothetical protein